MTPRHSKTVQRRTTDAYYDGRAFGYSEGTFPLHCVTGEQAHVNGGPAFQCPACVTWVAERRAYRNPLFHIPTPCATGKLDHVGGGAAWGCAPCRTRHDEQAIELWKRRANAEPGALVRGLGVELAKTAALSGPAAAIAITVLLIIFLIFFAVVAVIVIAKVVAFMIAVAVAVGVLIVAILIAT